MRKLILNEIKPLQNDKNHRLNKCQVPKELPLSNKLLNYTYGSHNPFELMKDN